MSDPKFSYQPPRLLAENLWEIRGEWTNKLGRRMTVIRLSDGRLFLHSAIRLRQEELSWLASLGTPAFIVAPNVFHCSDAAWMCERFPGAELFVPASKLRAFSEKGLRPRDLASAFPEIPGELRSIPMLGSRIEETAFVHLPSATLVLCDLAFNMGDVFTGLERMLMRWNKVGGLFGPSRLTRLIFTSNRRLLVESYGKLLAEPFNRVIVSHGEVLESGGRELLRAGVERIFGRENR